MLEKLFALVVAAFVVAPAVAADIPPAPQAPRPPVAPPAVYDWTGVYLGINGGGGFGSFVASSGGVSASEDLVGPFVGGQLGANAQWGKFVLGVEVDAHWADIKNTSTAFGVTLTDKVDWFGTARARAGLALDNWLIYGTGGLGYGDLNSSASNGVVTVSASESRMAWTAGGGIEVAYGPLVSRSEYLYIQSFNKTTNLGGLLIDSHVGVHLIRGAISYKFFGGSRY
jgi:outer membrane immunogenic protein